MRRGWKSSSDQRKKGICREKQVFSLQGGRIQAQRGGGSRSSATKKTGRSSSNLVKQCRGRMGTAGLPIGRSWDIHRKAKSPYIQGNGGGKKGGKRGGKSLGEGEKTPYLH